MLLLALLLIQIPYVQNKIKDKVVVYLEDKIHSHVSIGKLNVDFPKNIVLEKVYLENQQKDTLLYGNKIAVDISLFKLLNHKVEINSVKLTGIKANIKRGD